MNFNYTRNPGYIDLVVNSYRALKWHHSFAHYDNWQDWTKQSLINIRRQFHLSFEDLTLIVYWSIGFTILRYLYHYISSKWIRDLHIPTQPEREKLVESSWKMMVYLLFWSYCSYLVLVKYDYFENMYNIWNDWSLQMRIPGDVRLLYLLECGFYLHSIYATFFMDAVRKDFTAMVVHHLITLGLIGGSYGLKYFKIGLLVMFCHDVTDIFLEFAKCNYYLKRSVKDGRVSRALGTTSFVLFTLTWILFRLYWFPLKVMYVACLGSIEKVTEHNGCLITLLVVLLWILFYLNIYWFYFILIILYKAMVGGVGLSDSREELSDSCTTRDNVATNTTTNRTIKTKNL